MDDYSNRPVELPDVAALVAGPREDFISAIEEAIETQTGRSGLEDFCIEGGSVMDVEISNVELEPFDADDEEILGTFAVIFNESYHRGCRDMQWRNNFSGRGDFRINVLTNQMRVSVAAEVDLERGDDEDSEAEAKWLKESEGILPDRPDLDETP